MRDSLLNIFLNINLLNIRGLFDKFVDNGDNFLFLIRTKLKFLHLNIEYNFSR